MKKSKGYFRGRAIGDLERRTPGEALWLARKAAGLTVADAAAAAGVGRNAYRDAERAANRPATPLKIARRADPAPTLALLLALARRRSGLGLAEVARLGRVSRVTVHAMEARADAGLKAFWEKRGFRFPAGPYGQPGK